MHPQGFDSLQELTRHGYVPDPRPLPGGSGILLRHLSSPDLIVRSDGTIGLPLGQPVKAGAVAEPRVRKGRSWRRAFLIFVLLAAYTLFSMAVMTAILES